MRRATLFLVGAVLALAGCSLIFDGHDLTGTGSGDGGQPDLAAPGGGGDGGGAADLAGPDLSHPPAQMVTFGSPIAVSAPSGTTFITTLAAGDVDGDGHLDLVTANNGNTTSDVAVYLGDGMGGFTVRPLSVCSGHAYGLAVAPFDAKSGDDIVVTCTDQSTLNTAYFLATSTRYATVTTQPLSSFTTTTAIKPYAAIGADFTGDTVPDLVVSNYGPSSGTSTYQLWLLPSNKDGTFGMPQPLATGTHPGQLAVGKLNGDALLDLVVVTADPSVWRYLGGGSAPGAGSPTTVGANPVGLALGELNGTGGLDVVVARASQNLDILDGDGNGGFNLRASALGAASIVQGVIVADFDNNGLDDVFTVDSNTCDVFVRETSSGFRTRATVPCGGSATSGAIIVHGDFNENGREDVAFATSTGVRVLLNTSN